MYLYSVAGLLPGCFAEAGPAYDLLEGMHKEAFMTSIHDNRHSNEKPDNTTALLLWTSAGVIVLMAVAYFLVF